MSPLQTLFAAAAGATCLACLASASTITNRDSGKLWQPAVGSTWQIQLQGALTSNDTGGFPIWDIDLFDNSQGTIRALQAQGAKVICYFSAGSFENWRPDAKSFTSSDYGSPLDGWPGEWWINTKSANVRSLMTKRLQLAASKGCDGVDPDNTDGYENKNGLGLTQADAVDYINFLAGQAHALGLSVGLKNSGDVLASVIGNMQWSVNEQCRQYEECDVYAPFIKAGKPVFNIEYPKGDSTSNSDNVSAAKVQKLCSDTTATGFSLDIKNINLDSWIQLCPGVTPSLTSSTSVPSATTTTASSSGICKKHRKA